KRRSVDSNIGEVEGLVLIDIYELPRVCDLGLVQQMWAKQVSVRKREVAKMVGGKHREPGRGRATEVARWKGFVVVTVCEKEPHRDLAFVGLQPVAIGHELFFVECAWNAERTRALSVERLRRVDSLRSRNQVAAVRKFVLQ